ncbi:MAG: hypothetical protein COA88_09090 [Kordia sp.]|nr:MAG: hypothetical protein COA88_09090 [Kordia sp.]
MENKYANTGTANIDPPPPISPKETPIIIPVAGSPASRNPIDDYVAALLKQRRLTRLPEATGPVLLRRVYLDIVGHIPPANDVIAFLKDRRAEKRAEVIDRLLDDTDYIRHSSTVWSNLLVGRGARREVNRGALEKFLRESFARNRPWNEVVGELVAARGRNDENGATNFLLAHLNNDATPATAITAAA